MAKLAELTRHAAGKGADLVVFPEAFVGGYPKGIDSGARLGKRGPEGREGFRRYYESEIDLPGPDAARLGEFARDNSVHLVVGIIERDCGSLSCTALTYGPSGKLLAKHRKLMSTALERDARHGRLIMRPSLRELCSFAADPASWIHLGMCWSNQNLPARPLQLPNWIAVSLLAENRISMLCTARCLRSYGRYWREISS
ncbi:nitrilase-related carbon-nitrogen hydrolase [Bradyrhizobium sp. 2TAF36]|uniref:nitrilase-related carbon-nitrogen hydrolase n=1 Tax=Bradyrhizobium sp. 2TAF36 TaxID=3233016 RepID=UPI003F8FA47E